MGTSVPIHTGPRARASSHKPQASSFKLDRTVDLGYYRTYAGTVCSSMRAIRIWYQHHDKAGIAGGARDTQFPDFFFFSSKASSSKLREPQAASFKPQATRFKLQATGYKLPDLGPFIKFHGARTEGLNADERVVRMAHMPTNLMGRKSYLVTLRNFKLNCKELIIFCVSQRIWHARK